MEGICEVAGEMGTGAIVDIPDFMQTGPAIQKLIGVHTQTQTS
jgi:hypothetical protein